MSSPIDWALNLINQNIGQPLRNGIAGFENPQAPSGDVVQRALDQVPFLKNIRGFNEGMFGQQAVNNPQMNPVLDSAMMTPASKFGNALRSAQDMLPAGKYQPVHPEDVRYVAPALERMLNTPNADANYHLNGGLANDHAIVQPIAEYYMPGLTKAAGNDPLQIAWSLRNKIMKEK